MYVPFIFHVGDNGLDSESNYAAYQLFYAMADACIQNKWPIISNERYFTRLSRVEEAVFGVSMKDIVSTYCMNKVPTTEDMLALRIYPISQEKEDALSAQYTSPFDCMLDLLENSNSEFERIVGELLDRITDDFGEKPEGILIWVADIPKSLLRAANKRNIPVVCQMILFRPLFTRALNAFSLINGDSAEIVQLRYDRFMSEKTVVPMLTRKGLLRLFVSEHYMMDIHNVDNEPEYNIGVLHNSLNWPTHHVGKAFVSDHEKNALAFDKYERVLIRTRPGSEPTAEALDDSPTCFHFCCKCERVLGLRTKGMFEVMLAGRVAHEYGSYIFHIFCNEGIEDESKGPAPIEFLNFVLFGLCTPFTWLTDPDYLRLLLSNASESELYMRSFSHYTRAISQEDLELYYMSDSPARVYRLDEPLYFTKGHKPHELAAYYCTGGLHNYVTETCTWSIGEYTSFEFDLSESLNDPLVISAVLYDVAMDYESPTPTQIVTCEVNSFNCGSITLLPGMKYLRYTIPADCFTNNLRVKFSYSYLHVSGDLKIAVAFECMYISCKGQRLMEDVLSGELAVLTNNIIGLESQYSALKLQYSALNSQYSTLESQIKSIYDSRSWKLGNGLLKAAGRVIPRKKG